jgi:hypothetical protein
MNRFVPVEDLEAAIDVLSAIKPAAEDVEVADALAISGRGTSFPRVVAPVVDAVAFLAMAFGSNLPVYRGGEASPLTSEGESGDTTAGELAALLSISSRRVRVPPVAASSFCFRSLSSACFFFQASSFANRSAFFSSSVCAGGFGDFNRQLASLMLVSGPVPLLNRRTSSPFTLDALLPPLFLLSSRLLLRLESVESSRRLRSRSRESSRLSR